MALVGRGSLQRDNPHHESNSILLGPHGPRSQQATASAEGLPFEAGEGVETRREEDRRVRDISIEGRTSEDKLLLIPAAKYPNSSQRTPFAPYLRERESKSLFVSISASFMIHCPSVRSVRTCLLWSLPPPPSLVFAIFSCCFFYFDVIHRPRSRPHHRQ